MSPKTTTITWDQFKEDVQVLAGKVRELGRTFDSIIAITRGGLIPAALLARELGIVVIDTVCVGTYENGQQKSQETVFKGPGPVIDGGRRCLVVDDLVDSGKTAALVRGSMYPEAILAVVYGKPEGLPFADIHAREMAQESWLIFPWEDGID